MKMLGNFAIAVAKHPRTVMEIYDVNVSKYINKETIRYNVLDDNCINATIAHLNFKKALQ